MSISRESLEKFKTIYKKNYGIELNNTKALEIALRIKSLVKTIKSKKV